MEITAQETVVKLDLACGQAPREGFTGVDLYAPDADVKMDLLKFPWPWSDNSVDEIYSSHFIEHIPMECVKPYFNHRAVSGGHEGKDYFLAFFDECWRVLKKTSNLGFPAGRMTVACPCARSNRAFQDPTHRRFIVEETFNYLSRDWRKVVGLDHYRVECNFSYSYRQIVKKEMLRLHPEAQKHKFQSQWNVVADLHVDLIALE